MNTKKSKVTLVIPTRNRVNSLNRLLRSIAKQTYYPKQVVIVDASDNKLTENQLVSITDLEIKIIHSTPSVCLQRNIGLEHCHTEFVFLCDDDIEVSENYIELLVNYLSQHPKIKLASGLIYEKKHHKWQYAQEKISFLKLIFHYIFGLSVWTHIQPKDFSNNKFIQQFVAFYLKKGNRIARSGWPIVINYQQPLFKTPIYGLGASIIRNSKIRYETAFYENGIGDNYDFALAHNSEISVIKDCVAYHHKESTNRVNRTKAYYYRVSALHFILLKNKNRFNLMYFLWSLIGNTLFFILKAELKLLLYNLKLILRIIFNTPIYKQKKRISTTI